VNLITGSPLWLMIVLLAAIVAAAIEDAMRFRISNVTCLVVLLAAVVAMGAHGFPLSLWQNALVFVAVLALGTPLFAAGKMGGGDVKLLACLGLWVNFGAAVWLLVATLVAGGVLALGFIAARPLRAGNAGKPVSRNIPYGLAIAAGACLTFASQLGVIGAKPAPPDPYVVVR